MDSVQVCEMGARWCGWLDGRICAMGVVRTPNVVGFRPSKKKLI